MHTRLAPSNSVNLKIERLLTDYLFKQGHLSLPGIGVIRYDGIGEAEFDEPSGRYRFSEGSLHFESDPKTELEDELVMHISRETGKMKPLAASDLESFLHFGQELINISKPFYINGLGVLQKSATQALEFIQEDPSNTAPERVRRYSTEPRKQPIPEPMPVVPAGRHRLAMPANLLWGLGLLVLVLSGYSLFRYLGNASGNPASENGITPGAQATDTSAKAAAESVKTATAKRGVFNIVIEDAYRERALRRYADLKEWGHDIRMTTVDSLRFKLYIPVDAPLSDTARHRDSLRMFFGRPVRVETTVNE